MASAQQVLQDNSWISQCDRALLRLETGLALLGGLAVFGLMLLAVISVGRRNLLSQPLVGYVDWIEQVMPIIAFMGLAYVQRFGGHIRMDMLINRLQGRPLYFIELMTCLLALVVGLLLVWGSLSHFDRSFDFSAPLFSRDSSMDIALPIWPAKLIVPTAFIILCLRLILQILAYAQAIGRNTTAIAVPLAIDATTQAQLEAESLSVSQNHHQDKHATD